MNELWVGKREEEAVKAMITRNRDTARTAYKEDSLDVPRQFILLGTTDKEEFLTDAAGNRRYWPIAVGKIDHAGIVEIRDQLWGEAAALEASGQIERLEMPADLKSAAKAAQQEYETTGPVYEMIANVVKDFGGTIGMEVLWEIVGLGEDKRERRTDTQQKAIGKAIRQLGWERDRIRIGGERAYIYKKEA